MDGLERTFGLTWLASDWDGKRTFSSGLFVKQACILENTFKNMNYKTK